MHTLRHPCVLSRRCDFHDEAAGESNSFNGGSTQDEEQSSRCLKLAASFFKVFFSPRSFLSDGVRTSRKIKSVFLFDSAAVLVTNSMVT